MIAQASTPGGHPRCTHRFPLELSRTIGPRGGGGVLLPVPLGVGSVRVALAPTATSSPGAGLGRRARSPRTAAAVSPGWPAAPRTSASRGCRVPPPVARSKPLDGPASGLTGGHGSRRTKTTPDQHRPRGPPLPGNAAVSRGTERHGSLLRLPINCCHTGGLLLVLGEGIEGCPIFSASVQKRPPSLVTRRPPVPPGTCLPADAGVRTSARHPRHRPGHRRPPTPPLPRETGRRRATRRSPRPRSAPGSCSRWCAPDPGPGLGRVHRHPGTGAFRPERNHPGQPPSGPRPPSASAGPGQSWPALAVGPARYPARPRAAARTEPAALTRPQSRQP